MVAREETLREIEHAIVLQNLKIWKKTIVKYTYRLISKAKFNTNMPLFDDSLYVEKISVSE